MIRSFLHGMNLKSRSQRKCSRRGHDRTLGGLECLEGRVLLSGNPDVFTVNATTDTGIGTGDAGDLRYVLSLANADSNTDGTVITFDPTVFATPQTITLSPTLGPLALTNIAGPEVIDGPAAGLATVSGNKAVGIFSVASGVTATISGLTIDSGSTAANGGGIDNSGSLTISNDTLSNNTAAGSGGGIENEATGTLTDDGSTYTNNTAGGGGGAIDNQSSMVTLSGDTVTLTGDTFESNTAGASGGGIANEFNIAGASTLVVTQTTFTNNSAGGSGGGIDNGLTNTLTITSDIFDANTAAVSGGGIESEQGGTVNVAQSTFTNNTATSNGGAIDNPGGVLTIANSTINGNIAGAGGGGIFNTESGALTITDTTMSNNSATTLGGGGIDNEAGSTLTITGATIAQNTAVSGGGIASDGTSMITNATITNNSATTGGGLANEVDGMLTILGTTIANNSATTGGGLANLGIATLTDSTVAGNTAVNEGGGILNQGPVTLTLVACTVSGNTAGVGGGGLDNAAPSAVASLTDTLVAGNVEPGGTADDIDDAAEGVTGTFNLIGPGGSGGINNDQGGNIVLASVSGLNLSPLGDYGGPTETIALLAGSPAIGVGTPAGATDQRGFPLANPQDIGAFQTQAAGLVVNTTVDGIGSPAGELSLRQAVNLANQLSTSATISFDPTVFNTAQTITLTAGALVLSNTVTPETITGPTASSLGLTINGNNSAGVFQIDPGVTASLTDLTISGGSAVSGGGIDNGGSLALSKSTVFNTTGTTGGGIFSDGTLTIVNSTIDGNTATNTGGGAFFQGSTVTVVNSTIADNVVPGGSSAGAGLALSGGTVLLNNTIVALNIDLFSNGTTPDDIAGTPLSTASGFDLIGTGGAGGLVNGTNGNLVGVANPTLGVLANNGGPTETIALLSSSPAINAGSNALAVDPNTGLTLIYDQRGAPFPRVNNSKVDIGAFEFRGTVTPPSAYMVTSSAASGPGSLASVIALADADPNSGGSIITFDPTVFATMQTITVASTLTLSPPAGPIVINGPAAGVTISGGGLVGVLQVARGVTATITGVTISDGLTALSGGAIVNNLAANLTLMNDAFTSDAATYFGGAIYNNGGTLTILNSTFTSDSATYGLGGAIDNTGVLAVTNSTFTLGDAFQGGAIDNRSGSLAVRNSSFTFNIAIMGGAIFNDAIATVYGSTIANNMAVSTTSATPPTIFASFDGGAIANDHAGILTLTNSTLAFNQAGQAGGAIDSVGVLTAVNDTIAYNVVAPGGSGGGIYGATGTTNLSNTMVVLNTSGTGTTASSSDISGNVAKTSAFNLIGTGGAGGLVDGTGGNQVGVSSPGLATTLANNGGPTLTLALLAGSPAIDTGSNALAVDANGSPLVNDQRGIGFPRIVNLIVDIGAFERFLATTTTVTSSLNPSVVGNSVTFTIAVSPSTANLATPTGTVQLFNGTISLATVTLVNGTATFATSLLPFGVSQISAVYSGDSNFATSTSNILKQTVNEPTATPLSVAPAITEAATPAAVTVAGSVVAFTSIATGPHAPVAAVKKVASPTKVHPKGGSSVKFHQTKHTATLKRSVEVQAKHAKVKVKKK